MSQNVKVYRTLEFFAQGGATKMSTIDTDDSATILYWRPETDDTGSLYFGDGTKDFDVRFVLGAAADYWQFDVGNKRLTPAGSADIDLPAGSVDQADLASGIYTIEHFALTGNSNDFDNETIKLSRLWSAGTVVRVVYFTNGALGTNLGIDILDGGTDGSGTDVIDSCSDNLSGVDVNDITTPYALSANDYLNVKFDDVTNDISFTIDIQVKVPVVTAT